MCVCVCVCVSRAAYRIWGYGGGRGGGGNAIRECIGVQRLGGGGGGGGDITGNKCYVCGIAEVCITARGLGAWSPRK